MENTPQLALIPLEQDVALFHGNEMLLVRLSDDRVAATLNSLCALLEIRPQSQARRLRRSKVLAQYLLLIPVKTAGGSQRMDVLIVEAIHDWLLGVQIEQVVLEKRPLILALQIEAAAVSYRHFFGGQSAQPVAEPQAVPLPPPSRSKWDTLPDSPGRRLLAVLYDFLEEDQRKDEQLAEYQRAQAEQYAETKEWLRSLDQRVAASGQSHVADSGWLLSLSEALLRLLERSTGHAQAELEREMLASFRVPSINAIPGELWEDVLEWALWRARQPDDREGNEPDD